MATTSTSPAVVFKKSDILENVLSFLPFEDQAGNLRLVNRGFKTAAQRLLERKLLESVRFCCGWPEGWCTLSKEKSVEVAAKHFLFVPPSSAGPRAYHRVYGIEGKKISVNQFLCSIIVVVENAGFMAHGDSMAIVPSIAKTDKTVFDLVATSYRVMLFERFMSFKEKMKAKS